MSSSLGGSDVHLFSLSFPSASCPCPSSMLIEDVISVHVFTSIPARVKSSGTDKGTW